MNEYVYVLLADGDRTMRSSPEPFGVAVTTVEEAKRFLKDSIKTESDQHFYGYAKLKVFTNKDDALKWTYPKI